MRTGVGSGIGEQGSVLYAECLINRKQFFLRIAVSGIADGG